MENPSLPTHFPQCLIVLTAKDLCCISKVNPFLLSMHLAMLFSMKMKCPFKLGIVFHEHACKLVLCLIFVLNQADVIKSPNIRHFLWASNISMSLCIFFSFP